MNLLNALNFAWDRRHEVSHEVYETQFVNLLSHSYVELVNKFTEFLKSKGKEYDGEVFYCFQKIIVFMILADNEFKQGEYDAYLKFCEATRYEPLSVDDVYALYDRSTIDDLVEEIKFLSVARNLDEEKYLAAVSGFCFLALMGDTELDENEYYILTAFLDLEKGDYYPSSWENLKKEWN